MSVAVATLWSAPDRVRAVDEPALGYPPDRATGSTAMTTSDREDLAAGR